MRIAIVIHILKITVDDAIDIMSCAVALDHFRTTPESQKALDDLVISARVKAKLVETYPAVRVTSTGGVVFLHTEVGPTMADQLAEELKEGASKIAGVKEVKIEITPTAAFFSD